MALAPGGNNPARIAVDGANVYWVDQSPGGALMKVPISGGSPTTLYTGGVPSGVAVDDTSVYWTDSTNGTVMKLTPK